MFKGKIKGIAKAASKTFGPKAASSEGVAPAAQKRGMGLFGKVVKAAKAAMPAKKMKSGGMADKAGRAMKKTAADAKGRAMKKGK